MLNLESAINYGPIGLHNTGFLVIVIFSIYQWFMSSCDHNRISVISILTNPNLYPDKQSDFPYLDVNRIGEIRL